VSIDDLLTAARDHREKPDPGDLGPAVLLKLVLLSAVLGFAAYQLILLFGYRVPYLLLFSVVAALLLARKITIASHGEPEPPQFADRPPTWTHQDTNDRPYDGVRRWVGRLGQVRGDADGFNRVMRPVVVALVDERLRLRHGVDRQRDPKRARELLGEQLWAFVDRPVTRAPKPRQLAALAEAIERL
jgi:hypothetical protein